jgi:flagellin-like protein
MNVFGKNERSWRKARKRGVSPIIATILLVAITVVLAAVLYVLISGLTHGVGSAPLAWGWGSVTNATGAASSTTGCIKLTTLAANSITFTPTYCYTAVISPGSGITTSNVLLSLRSAASGATVAWPASATLAISVLSPTVPGIIAMYCTASGTSNIWLSGGTAAASCPAASTWVTSSAWPGSFQGGMTLVVATAGTSGTIGLLGIEIEAVGQSGYSGTQASSPFS